jgi:LysR family transcriptional regulator, nitrogen assimilation regulatory protein
MTMAEMDLRQLHYFVQVAELGGFTRASQVLGVAQPALSRQVRTLELELRQPLLLRNGRGVVLTEAGRRLLAHARGILHQAERAREDLVNQRGALSGRLAVGLPPSLSRILTAPMVDHFRTHFPDARLAVVEGLSVYTLEWLMQGRIDCAVVYNPAPAPQIELQPVRDELLHLVSARGPKGRLIGRPLTLAQLAAKKIVVPSRPHAIRMRLEMALAEEGLKPNVVLEVDSVPSLLEVVARGGLSAVLPMDAVRGTGREKDFSLQRIGRPPLATTLWIATSAQRPGTPLLAAALEALRGLLLDGERGASG